MGFKSTRWLFPAARASPRGESQSATGELIIGRNLDYQLNGFFDAHPTVAYHEPTDGTQAYVSIGSAGLHTPSLTAFNQSGIYLAVHMVPTNETSFSGVPVFFTSSEVISKARTLDEAIAIFRRAHPTAGWTFVLASIHEKRVVSSRSPTMAWRSENRRGSGTGRRIIF